MEVDIALDGTRLEFHFSTDNDDIEQIKNLRFDMGKKNVYVDLIEYEAKNVHPDLICLTAILLCNPFVGQILKINFPMSKKFHENVSSVISRYQLVLNSDRVESIERDNKYVPGLAFSGGADSCAALAILPPSCVPIFLWRPGVGKTSYNPDAPLKICSELEKSGYLVKKVETDLEYIREPVGFPTDLANGVPSILLSEFLSLDSISFGTVLESGFGVGHEKYIEYGSGAHWKFFNTLFNSVGLELSMPTIGISEVGTALINNKSVIGALSQSCIRGVWGNPCLRCWKCFRKKLLNYSLGISGESDFISMMKSNEVQIRLSNFPISHENVICFSLQRIDLDEMPFFKPLADKLDMGKELGMLEKWFPPSLGFVPDKYRHTIRENILGFIDPMGPKEEALIMSWDMKPHLELKQTIDRQEKLTSFWQDFTTRFG